MKALRIGLNALYLIPGKVGGSEFYFRYLVDSLTQIDQENMYFLFLNEECADTFPRLPNNFKIIRCSINARLKPWRIIWEQIFLPWQARKLKLDILHSISYISPLFLPCFSVVSILDANYVHFPENFSSLELLGWKTLVPLSAYSSNQIITLSKVSSQDIISAFKVPPHKIHPIHLAPHRMFHGSPDQGCIDTVLTKYTIQRPYILCIAASYPSKNIPRLLSAYHLLKGKSQTNYTLVLVGMRGGGHSEIIQCIEQLQLENVVMPGWVPDEDLPPLYQGAAMFVLPSLYEGFGIPILEAMACGTPVITSNLSAMPEITGEAAVLVDPYNIDIIAEEMHRVLSNQALRQDLIQKGLVRSQQFSWTKVAQQTLEIYTSLGSSNSER